MKILIKANNPDIAARIKEILEAFGKGMNIYTRDNGISYYPCVILVGDTNVWQEPELLRKFAEPASNDDWAAIKKELWALYRDHLKDMFGTKCTCGLYDFCHCH